MAEWKWHSTYAAGWVMSLIPSDMDGDGDTDILASDRKGEHAGTLWLENPGPGEALTRTWPEHRIGASGEEVMFLDQVDLDQDGFKDVLAAVQPRKIVLHQRRSRDGHLWRDHVIRIPETAGTAKAIRAADLDLDGKVDLVISCEHAEGNLSGVMWLSYKGSVMGPEWEAHDVSGSEGVKYDLVQTVDLDSDGDLDILTTEEASNLGVIWYENPTRRVGGQRASRPEPARHGMSSQP